jgi:hypothetical protein
MTMRSIVRLGVSALATVSLISVARELAHPKTVARGATCCEFGVDCAGLQLCCRVGSPCEPGTNDGYCESGTKCS